MTQNEVDFFQLRVTGVTAAGKRKFDAEGKRKLIDACLQPGASIAGLALKAGVNANHLHKWIQLRERANAAAATASVKPLSSAFVPVVTVNEVALHWPRLRSADIFCAKSERVSLAPVHVSGADGCTDQSSTFDVSTTLWHLSCPLDGWLVVACNGPITNSVPKRDATPISAARNCDPTRYLAQTAGKPHWLRHSFIMPVLTGASSPMPLWKSFSFAS